MLPFLLASLFGSVADVPTTMFISCAGLAALFGCCYCYRCRLRDCCCCKCLLRAFRYDKFDDFELRVMVHEASYGQASKRTYVKVSAGNHVVKTERSSNGKYYEKLDVFVEQGTRFIKFDLMDSNGNNLANLKLDPVKDVLETELIGVERTFNMKPNHKGVVHPKLVLTMFVNLDGPDEEAPLIKDGSADLNILLMQHISKAQAKARKSNAAAAFSQHRGSLADPAVSEIETLREAGCGRAELFRGLIKTESVYLAVLGPPHSRRWHIGLWPDYKSYEERKKSIVDVDMLKIQSIRGDTIRSRIFVINYFDDNKVPKKLTLRSLETNRDVWVEMLTHLVNIAHDQREEMKEMRRHRPGNSSSS